MVADKTLCYIFLSKTAANRGQPFALQVRQEIAHTSTDSYSIGAGFETFQCRLLQPLCTCQFIATGVGIGGVGLGEDAVHMLFKAATNHPLVALLRVADDVAIRLRAAIGKEFVSSPHQAAANLAIGHGTTYDDFPCFNEAVPAGQDRVK